LKKDGNEANLVEPAKNEDPRLMESDIPSMTLERPKSVMMACPCSSTRMFPYYERKKLNG